MNKLLGIHQESGAFSEFIQNLMDDMNFSYGVPDKLYVDSGTYVGLSKQLGNFERGVNDLAEGGRPRRNEDGDDELI